MPKSKSPPDFETALAELETIVSTMEDGRISLDEMLSTYRRGVELLRHCQQTLASAEGELQLLEQFSIDGKVSEFPPPVAAADGS